MPRTFGDAARCRSMIASASGESSGHSATIASGMPVRSNVSCSQIVSSTGSGEPSAACTWMTLDTFCVRDSAMKSSAR